MNPKIKIQITQGVGWGGYKRHHSPPLLPFKSGGPRWKEGRNPRSIRHVAKAGSIHEMFLVECEWHEGLAEALQPAGQQGYWVLQDGWANTMGRFLAQRENTAFSVMKRWALWGARSCARYI